MLDGRSAIVTGSTSGIGLGIARALAAEGASVFLNGFGDARQIEALRARLVADYHLNVLFDGADIAKPADVRRMVTEATRAFGAVDVLINNAGIQHTAPTEDFADERWDAIVATNLSSNFHAIKAVLPR
jgi:3-hydroxybutyrate dehydrogenase